jgi:Eukaryotic aspartyl protease
LEVDEAAYGEYEMYEGQEFLAVMDSGTQFIYLRQADFDALFGFWVYEFPSIYCSSELCLANETCERLARSLSSLKFKFGDSWSYVIPPSQYLINGTQFGVPNQCVIGVQGGIEEGYPAVLGNIFLKNYYMMYDLENRKVGISLH